MGNTKEEKRVKMCIDVGEDVADWIRERAKKNLPATCREVEVLLIEAKRRDEEAANEGR